MNWIKGFVMAAMLAFPLMGCQGGPQIKPLEEMTEPNFVALCDSTTLVSKVTVSVLIRNGDFSREKALKLAADIEIVLANPAMVSGPNFLTDALKKAGFSQQDAISALEMIELFLRLRFDTGTAALPLTPRMVQLSLSVVDGIRQAATVTTSPEDEQAAQKLLKDVQAAR